MRVRTLAVVLISFSLTACLRYVPSRTEIEQKSGGSGEIAGAEQFEAMELQRQAQLEQLIKQRLTDVGTLSDLGYKIGHGDVVGLEVFGLPELTADLEVSPAGTIAPALVGEVPAAGLTLAELKTRLTRTFATYVKNPEIRLTVKNFQAHKVSVIGAVQKAGVYPLKQLGRSLTDLLSEAGGRTDAAGSRVVLIPASSANHPPETTVPTDDKLRGIEIDIEDLFGGVDHAPLVVPLLSGDTIVVPEAGTVEVDGEVARPGSYKLSSRLSALGAVASAGGFSYSADVNQVEIIREFGGGKKAAMPLDLEQVALNGKNDIRLRNGDVVRVPSHSGRFARRQVVEVLNSIFRGVGMNGRVN